MKEFLILKASTGEVSGFYETAPELGNDGACFAGWDGFIFRRVEKGQVQFVTAPL